MDAGAVPTLERSLVYNNLSDFQEALALPVYSKIRGLVVMGTVVDLH
jgi:hypothetical protein